jgi:hypothetical protein
MNTLFSQVELTKRQKSWPTAEAKSCFLPEGTLTSEGVMAKRWHKIKTSEPPLSYGRSQECSRLKLLGS